MSITGKMDRARKRGSRVCRTLTRELGPIAFVIVSLVFGGCASQVSASTQHLERFEYSHIAMGVRARIALYAPDESRAIAAASAAFTRIEALDAELSDYRPDSELSQLGAHSGGPPIEVSDDLFRVLERSIDISCASDGAFDVTVGPPVALWREARKSRLLPSDSAIAAAREHVGWQSIELDRSRRTVHLAKRDMHLDVGGIGKGFACDEALAVLAQHGVTHCLVALAGDIRLGDAPPDRDGWRIDATSGEEGTRVDALVLSRCGVSTSGDTEQFVEIDGARYSHIVDPRTGGALTSRLRMTVIACDATTADALATAASVLGALDGVALCTRLGAKASIESANTRQVLEGSAGVLRR
jgi:thiamine biosynthesis lipoprotein